MSKPSQKQLNFLGALLRKSCFMLKKKEDELTAQEAFLCSSFIDYNGMLD